MTGNVRIRTGVVVHSQDAFRFGANSFEGTAILRKCVRGLIVACLALSTGCVNRINFNEKGHLTEFGKKYQSFFMVTGRAPRNISEMAWRRSLYPSLYDAAKRNEVVVIWNANLTGAVFNSQECYLAYYKGVEKSGGAVLTLSGQVLDVTADAFAKLKPAPEADESHKLQRTKELPAADRPHKVGEVKTEFAKLKAGLSGDEVVDLIGEPDDIGNGDQTSFLVGDTFILGHSKTSQSKEPLADPEGRRDLIWMYRLKKTPEEAGALYVVGFHEGRLIYAARFQPK